MKKLGTWHPICSTFKIQVKVSMLEVLREKIPELSPVTDTILEDH